MLFLFTNNKIQYPYTNNKSVVIIPFSTDSIGRSCNNSGSVSFDPNINSIQFGSRIGSGNLLLV